MKRYILLFFLYLQSFTIQTNNYNLIEVNKKIPSIILDIRYATKNNFTGKIIYQKARCFLRKETLKKLKNVQNELKKLNLGLKIFDAYRPHSAQYKLWKVFPVPGYVADPKKGSKHNRGSAVDCTLINLRTGKELIMPSKFDDLSKKAHRNYKTMQPQAAKNCKLLENMMQKHGFIGLLTEWWHFDDINWKNYPLLDIPFEKL